MGNFEEFATAWKRPTCDQLEICCANVLNNTMFVAGKFVLDSGLVVAQLVVGNVVINNVYKGQLLVLEKAPLTSSLSEEELELFGVHNGLTYYEGNFYALNADIPYTFVAVRKARVHQEFYRIPWNV